MNSESSKILDAGNVSNKMNHVSVAVPVSDKDSSTANISPFFWRVFSAAFYGISSFLIIVVNKIVLTNYRFPSTHALGIGQMLVTLLVLYIARFLKIVNFPPLSKEVPKKIWPLPIFFIGNLVCGLGGTKHLSLPMFTVLRRFTILMTLVGEYFILKQKQTPAIVMTVFAMVGGAIVAAVDDLSFEVTGYMFVLCNDFFTAANNICVKKKLEARDFGKYGLLFYNAFFMILPLSALWWYSGEIEKTFAFTKWLDWMFMSSFLMSCFMGFILMYSTVLCTAYNSALTTTIVGVIKNILITYVGMYLGGDYIFSWTNFIGLNISMSGSLVYSYITFVKPDSKPTKSAVLK
ncbi:UDP-N-acetylglucosamine/UDP-glucose/GDP-mannose transporter-like [Uloborus diversus]|uniref:UDP-N-acetylglucosamine/UDP-glucose/GDP-mannose transporter-like n=1 Tax=Uloborus diversus TaxID=327109 RepID=UPI00240A666F|nr:UDP-N-acetylglucosamine/UDP-glucose/GDP-mannose transporter-like [Uloborus diversus]